MNDVPAHQYLNPEEVELHTLRAENERLTDMWSKDKICGEELLRQNKTLTAENERLRAALGRVMVGGNHLATIIGATHPQTGSHYEAALQFYGPGHQYEAWCCWNAIMQARAALKEEKTDG
jgi:hypothetical protein